MRSAAADDPTAIDRCCGDSGSGGEEQQRGRDLPHVWDLGGAWKEEVKGWWSNGAVARQSVGVPKQYTLLVVDAEAHSRRSARLAGSSIDWPPE
jgi:hypothetical protein